MARKQAQVLDSNGSTIDPDSKGLAVVNGKSVKIMNTIKTAKGITSIPSLRNKKTIYQHKSFVLVEVKKKECLWVKLA
jgi:hypothetical protein